MPIESRLKYIMADRKVRSRTLSKKVGVNEVNLSNITTGRIKSIRFSTLNAICRELNCQPGDLFRYVPDESSDNKDK